MNKVKRKKNNKLIPMLCVILGILLVVCISLFLKKDDDIDAKNANEISEQNEVSDEEKNEGKNEEKSEAKDETKDDAKEEVSLYEIETDYCKLYFPKTWKEQIEVKYTDEMGYKAEFYGTVKGKDAVHLFDVCFNSDDGFLLGFIQNDDEIINISIDMCELEFDDSWKQEEIDELYAMQEDMNILMESLSKIENYVEP